MLQPDRNGAIGALLGEYGRAISELQTVISVIPANILVAICDPYTQDENCRSIQAILAHVVSSGYGYATSIYNSSGKSLTRRPKIFQDSASGYVSDLSEMFDFTVGVFSGLNDEALETNDPAKKMITGWGQSYDIEQLTEHAIVHILRHRRQIERLLLTW